MQSVHIIGGGLAGCEAAWQAARRGCHVTLFDMKPCKLSPAHESAHLGELVCSNSFRSDDPTSAIGLLKAEMTILDSLIMETARNTAVPAGKALAVDRTKFAEQLHTVMHRHEKIRIVEEEIREIPVTGTQPIILATGPLTSDPLAESLSQLTGRQRLSFYDAIAPIVEKESLNLDIIYQKSRYDDGPGDYLNCPMSREQYANFIEELNHGTCVPLQDFENAKYFEGCLPVEVMSSRGPDTLRFGPMKPVGLADPRNGNIPYAVVQLRKENLEGSHYNMVGFQTKLKYSEQKRIFRMIPGMETVVFSRFGSIHRNTFICAPEVLSATLQLRSHPQILVAGQLSGVEGYIESAAMGLLAGINAVRIAGEKQPHIPPEGTAMAALIGHLTGSSPRHFQPSNVNYGLFSPLDQKIPKKLRGKVRAEHALAQIKSWKELHHL